MKLLGIVIVLTLLLSFCGNDAEETDESALDKNNAQSQTEAIKESEEKEDVITETETVRATKESSVSDSQDSQTDDTVIEKALQKFNKGNYKYIVDEYGNKWTCSYHFDDDEVRVLEGDHITVYGECQGTSKSKTVLRKQVTMPYIKVKYIQ